MIDRRNVDLLAPQFRRLHPKWFDLRRYPKPTAEELRQRAAELAAECERETPPVKRPPRPIAGGEDFERKLRALPPHLAAVAFYLSQGKSFESISSWMCIHRDSVKVRVCHIKRRLGFKGNTFNLAVAILASICE